RSVSGGALCPQAARAIGLHAAAAAQQASTRIRMSRPTMDGRVADSAGERAIGRDAPDRAPPPAFPTPSTRVDSIPRSADSRTPGRNAGDRMPLVAAVQADWVARIHASRPGVLPPAAARDERSMLPLREREEVLASIAALALSGASLTVWATG